MNVDRLDEAGAANRRVLELSLAEQDITSLSAALHDAASLAALSGDLATAATLTGAAERIVDESGGQPPPSLVNRIDAMPALSASLSADDLQRPARPRPLVVDRGSGQPGSHPPVALSGL